MTDNPLSLMGQFLAAVPGIDDSRFNQAVIYIYEHSAATGAKGIVINKPTNKILFEDIFAQLNYQLPKFPLPPVLVGGPEFLTNGFVLHSSEYHNQMTQPITTDVALTATQEILHDISGNCGPQEFLMALGCATWGQGQLEEELAGNVWLTAPASRQILFHTPHADKWDLTLKSIGIDSIRFSQKAGKA